MCFLKHVSLDCHHFITLQNIFHCCFLFESHAHTSSVDLRGDTCVCNWGTCFPRSGLDCLCALAQQLGGRTEGLLDFHEVMKEKSKVLIIFKRGNGFLLVHFCSPNRMIISRWKRILRSFWLSLPSSSVLLSIILIYKSTYNFNNKMRIKLVSVKIMPFRRKNWSFWPTCEGSHFMNLKWTFYKLVQMTFMRFTQSHSKRQTSLKNRVRLCTKRKTRPRLSYVHTFVLCEHFKRWDRIWVLKC